MFVRDVARALEDAGVDYCVVGGLAVNLHGIPRTTYDMDLVVPLDARSLGACRAALEGLGLRCRLPIALESLAETSRDQLLARNLIAVTFTDPSDPLREVDVLVAPVIAPDELVRRAKRLESAELALQVAALEDLVALKREAGRPQDLADLAHLERLLPRR